MLSEEDVAFLRSYMQDLQKFYKHIALVGVDSKEPDMTLPETSDDDERCARLADLHDLDGNVFRNLFGFEFEDGLSSLRTLSRRIETIPRIIAKIEGAEATSKLASKRVETRRTSSPVKPKRSTARGEAQIKLVSALTKHHQYENGSCLNSAPIGVRDLARQAEVSESTASEFFKRRFKGHRQYQQQCANQSVLIMALRMLNDECSPHILYSDVALRENDRDDE